LLEQDFDDTQKGYYNQEQQYSQTKMVPPDSVYSYGVEETLRILKNTAVEFGNRASYEFYYACLDRLDILITQRDSTVGKDEVVSILRQLSYFRPREYDREEKRRKAAGKFTKRELMDEMVSVRHKEII
jgi:hypothetical protein